MKDGKTSKARDRVSAALRDLMLETSYSDITVRELIDRAGVSRSTFYTHFDGKDDVLVSYHAGFWSHVSEACMQWRDGALMIAPVEPLALHLREKVYREFAVSLLRTGRMPALRETALERLSEKFERELGELSRGSAPAIPLDVVARFLAATFFDLVIQWLETGSARTPAELERIYQQLVGPSIDAVSGGAARRRPAGAESPRKTSRESLLPKRRT